MSDHTVPPGTLIAGRFEIERVAGRGGMGVVYRALDHETKATVALKLLLETSPDGGERFLREGRLLAQLRHPNIVSYVAHGRSTAGTFYLAMEWLDGHDLEDHLRAGALSLDACRTLLEGVASGLAAAHAQCVIHRDLKPTNLFLVGGDIARVKVLDFGIARPEDATRALTQTGAIVGTLGYMAPEQARSQRALTPAADLFSLGCVLYRCLTNETPFTANHPAAALGRVLFDEPPPVHVRRPDVSVALNRLLLRLLAKDPHARWPDAAAFLEALEHLEQPDDRSVSVSAPTLSALAPGIGTFAETERGLISVVLARVPSAGVSGDSPTASSQDFFDDAARSSLEGALDALGVSVDFLVDTSLVVTVSPLESPRDQAARAAYAALLIRERWPEAVISVATGRGTLNARAPVGEALDRAARPLPEEPGVFLDALSAQLLDGRFAQTLRPDGEHLLLAEREMDASRPLLGKPTPCVGREAELAHLDALFRTSVDEGCARVAVVTASPGVGKSRLRHEFQRRLAAHADAPLILSGAAELMTAGAPYGLLGDALRRHCGVGRGEADGPSKEGPSLPWERLRASMPSTLGPADADRVAAFLGEVAGIETPPSEASALRATARADPHILRDRIARAFLAWLQAECALRPVVFLADDLHWADPLSVSLFDQALRVLSDAPFFVLALARPEVKERFPRLWQAHGVYEVTLKGLSRRACVRLAELALGPGTARSEVERLVDQSAGNALFLEELIRAAVAGETGGGSATVIAMLQARIGRFDTGPRRALLAASVFGQSFRASGVAALLGLPPDAAVLESSMNGLLDAEVIEVRDEPALLHFRHALVRDAAYSLLAEDEVNVGHLRAADFLERMGEPDSSIIAEHYEAGADLARAAEYHTRAAEEALDTFVTERALRSVARGLACHPTPAIQAKLHAYESVTHFYAGALERVYPAAQRALPHLRPGSRAWMRTVLGAFSGCPFGPPDWVAQFPHLIDALVSHDPDPDARVVYAESLAWMVVLSVQVVPVGAVRPVLERLRWACDEARAFDPNVDRLAWMAETHAGWHCDPRPWTVLQSARRTISASQVAGDVRTERLALAYGETETWAELGAPDRALEGLEARSELFGAHEALGIGVFQTSRALLRCALDLAGADDEALEVASALCEKTRVPPPMLARAHDMKARLHLVRGEGGLALSHAREAHRVLERIPNCAPNTRATLMAALRLCGDMAEAVGVAEDSLGLLETFGGVGYAEVELRLGIAETFFAAGDPVRGRAELEETLRQIDLRAQDIDDPDARARYLTRNPFCVRARALFASQS